MRFADLPAETDLIAHLKDLAARDRLPHALLLTGEDGLSGLALAHALAQRVLCESPQQGDACGQCPACHKVAALQHPDLYLGFPFVSGAKSGKPINSDEYLEGFRDAYAGRADFGLQDWGDSLAAANKQLFIPIAEIRNLQKRMALRSYEGGWKVILFWRIEKMNQEAANAFLKFLEEPTPRTLLLLTTPSPRALLPTVLSRCQRLELPPYPPETLEGRLAELQPDLSPELRRQFALQARGDLRQARILAQQAGASFYEQFRNWMRHCVQWKFQPLQQWITEFSSLPRESQKLFLELSLERLEDALHQRYGLAPQQATPEEQQFLEGFANFLTPHMVERGQQELQEAHRQIARNLKSGLVMQTLSWRLHAVFTGQAV